MTVYIHEVTGAKPVLADPAVPVKLSDAQVEAIITAAMAEGKRHIDAYLEQIGGDRPMCGFAWVNIKPARGQFIKVLKAKKIGSTDEYYGGYTIRISHSCQNMDAKEAGARALAKELRKYGIKANVGTRID